MAEIDMDAVPGAIAKARAAGYKDEEIYDFLAKQAPGQFKRAKDAGYSPSEIISHLTAQPQQPQPAQAGMQPSGQPYSQQQPSPFETGQLASEPPQQPLSWGDVGSQALQNVPASAGRLVSDTAQAVAHPIETLGNIKDLGLGILEKLGLPGSSHEKYADAVGQYFADRYGGIENVKRAIATDPVGVLADAAALLTGGEGALARAPGMLGKVGEISGAAGRFIDPIRRGGQLVGAAGNALTVPLGVTTGVGREALRTAAAAGAEGGPAGAAFYSAMRGQAPIEGVVQDARTAVGNMRQERGIDYQAGMVPVKNDKSVLDWTKVDNAVKNMEDVAVFKGSSGTLPATAGQVIAPKTESIRSEIKQVINHWKSLDPAEFHTPEGFDALKRQVGELRDLTQPNTPDRRVADFAYNAVKSTIVDQAPEYAKVMKGYETASDLIKEIETTLSLKKGTSIDTALRKLQSVMRNNVQTNYGRRTDLAQMLQNAGAPNLMERLAGQALSSAEPRGLARVLAGAMTGVPASIGLAGAGLLGAAKGAVLAAPALATASPRLMGEAAYRAGQASRLSPLAAMGLRYGRQLGRLPEQQPQPPTAAPRPGGPPLTQYDIGQLGTRG